MEWIFKLIRPVIENCETPEEAEKAVKTWAEKQEPAVQFAAILAIQYINAHWENHTKS